MNTEKTLYDKFSNFKSPSWRTHKLKEVDIDYVMWHLVIKDFAVEIDGHKYDITFGLNCNNEIGYSISMEGSPSLTIFNYGIRQAPFFRCGESIPFLFLQRKNKNTERFLIVFIKGLESVLSIVV